jgi:hypothetical protein
MISIKSSRVCFAGVILVVAAIFAGCSRPGIKGDGTIKTEDRPVADFSKVEVAGGYHIEWAGGKPALQISADQNLLPLISTVVSGNKLRIDSKGELAPTKNIAIILSSTSLEVVQLSGSVNFKAHQIAGHDLKLESSGSAVISVDGTVANFDASLAGASKLNANSLQTQTSRLSLFGASDADVNVTDTLNASIAGAGSVTYSGNPKSVEKNIAGVGSIRPR